jgi:hypothetical protein
VLAVVASVVVKAEIARLAALNMAKHPVAARNEVATGFITRCVKAGAVADGSIGFSHAVVWCRLWAAEQCAGVGGPPGQNGTVVERLVGQ